MSNYVFVIDPNKQPQNPVHPAQARLLLNQGQAAVYRRYPFTIILKESKPAPEIQQITLKIDPGSKTKFNRTRLNLPKTHWLDAACVGKLETLKVLTNKPLLIQATGRGTRQMCGTDKYGFPTFPCFSCDYAEKLYAESVRIGICSSGLIDSDRLKSKNH
ncbi:hypothetical protein PL8927_760163 [Planktothrix serta PCC 8927]|uniref:RRXRR domain-containing protein n=1 Tax=Planktothrix serta PCC 8927 TaxID=671068 RepID=A0A7Z9BXD7_9CYAN|nr:hypothetical protein PL8927_760163 [Planktothrix serta PCC 8927]